MEQTRAHDGELPQDPATQRQTEQHHQRQQHLDPKQHLPPAEHEPEERGDQHRGQANGTAQIPLNAGPGLSHEGGLSRVEKLQTMAGVASRILPFKNLALHLCHPGAGPFVPRELFLGRHQQQPHRAIGRGSAESRIVHGGQPPQVHRLQQAQRIIGPPLHLGGIWGAGQLLQHPFQMSSQLVRPELAFQSGDPIRRGVLERPGQQRGGGIWILQGTGPLHATHEVADSAEVRSQPGHAGRRGLRIRGHQSHQQLIPTGETVSQDAQSRCLRKVRRQRPQNVRVQVQPLDPTEGQHRHQNQQPQSHPKSHGGRINTPVRTSMSDCARV